MAYRGIDLRDLYRRGSGLTPRRLVSLIRWLPYEDPVAAILRDEHERAEQLAVEAERPTPDRIRDRKAAFEARNQRAKEAAANG